MAKNFALSSIVPEADTITDKDGTPYEVRSLSLLSAVEYAKLNRLQQALPKALDQMNTLPDDATEEEVATAGTNVETHINALLKLLIPDMPTQSIADMPFGKKAEFMEWWRDTQNPGAVAEGEA